MKKFFIKHKHTIVIMLLLVVLCLSLSSCRWDSSKWYSKPYTSWGQEWADSWNGGKGVWNTLWAWPINILSWPIAGLCSAIGKGIGGSYFWGIFFTTLIVRTLAWPVYAKQNGMSLKMQLMQPEISKIQMKYKNRQDPRSQQMMQQEMMKVYKKYKVNPLGCFGTMFLQFPIFMSMYEVVQRINATKTTTINGAVSVEVAGDFALHNTKFLGFDITSAFMASGDPWKDRIFGLVVALLFGGVTFLQQKLASRPPKYQRNRPDVKRKDQHKQQNTMKWVMIFMNVMFVIMSLQSTSLAIYWLIGGIYQIFQSFVGRKLNERAYERATQRTEIL